MVLIYLKCLLKLLEYGFFQLLLLMWLHLLKKSLLNSVFCEDLELSTLFFFGDAILIDEEKVENRQSFVLFGISLRVGTSWHQSVS